MHSSPDVPKVSIGLPVYNGEDFIQEAIDSILHQTYSDFELIISDNASTDSTQLICQTYASKDPRIRYYRSEQNRGSAWNFNRVFELSRGMYFKWAAHDDICAHNFLSECVPVLEENQQVVLCFPKSSRNIDSTGKLEENWFITEYGLLNDEGNLSPSDRFRHILKHSVWCLEFFGLFRTATLKQTSSFKKGAVYGNFGGSDKVLLAELSLLGQFFSIDKDLFYRRYHPHQATALDTRARQKRVDPTATFKLPDPVKASIAYFHAVHSAPIGFYEKLYCYDAIVQLALQKDKLQKLFLPGPNNYFGLNWTSK